jgi:hypothetical protein
MADAVKITVIATGFEEKKEKIYTHMSRFGWDLEALEKDKKIFIYEYSPQEVDRFIKEGGAIEALIRANKIDRVVIDSITSYAVLHDTEAERRASIIRLLEMLRRWNVTTLLTSEAEALERRPVNQHQDQNRGGCNEGPAVPDFRCRRPNRKLQKQKRDDDLCPNEVPACGGLKRVRSFRLR